MGKIVFTGIWTISRSRRIFFQVLEEEGSFCFSLAVLKARVVADDQDGSEVQVAIWLYA
jgi:hypothetical protein